MMNKNNLISRADVMDMVKTGLVSFSFAPITVLVMGMISSLAL